MDDDRRPPAMITPLRMIFWGALLCLIDVTMTQRVNDVSFKFDLLDDFLGMLLVTLGVFRLSRFAPSRSYAKGMAFVKVVAVVSTFKELIDHWSFNTPPLWSLAWTFFSMVELAAMVVFCACMRLLCRAYELEDAARSWNTTALLYFVIYAIPLGLFYSAGMVAEMTGNRWHYQAGGGALLYLVIFFFPLIHFFVSTSRMARAAGRR